MSLISYKSKKEKKENEKFFQKRLKLKIPKFLDPISYHRITGDFIIMDKLNQSNFDEIIYPYSLLLNFKFIKQIHIRKNGVVFEYDYLDLNFTPPNTNLLQSRLESLNNKKYYEFSKILYEFNKYDFQKMKLADQQTKQKEKVKVNDILQAFDLIFFDYKNEKMFVMGNELLNISDYNVRFLGLSSNIIPYICNENDPNFFKESFIKSFNNFICYSGIYSYIDTISQSMINTMYKYDGISEKIYYQCFQTILGLHYSKMKVIEKLLPNENLFVFAMLIQNTLEEEIFFNKLLFCKAKNYFNDNQNYEKKKFEDLGMLLTMYYKK